MKPDFFLHECFGNASTVAESLDSVNPCLGDDSEVPDPILKFLQGEALRGPVEAVRDMGWEDVIAADVRKGATPEDQPCEDFTVVATELRSQENGLTMKIGLNRVGQIVTAKTVKF
jgi:hypothetical protein